MKQRKISEDDVFRTLENPDKTGLPTQPKRKRVRWQKGASTAIDVVYEERIDVIRVITTIRITTSTTGKPGSQKRRQRRQATRHRQTKRGKPR